MRLLFLSFLVGLAGCASAPPPIERFEPGVRGSSLRGMLEVITIDEETREPMPATITIVHGSGTLLPLESQGRITLSDPALAGAISIHVTDVPRPQALVGVTGSEIVIPIARSRVRPIAGEVHGAASLGASEVAVGAPVRPSLMRTEALDHASSAGCAMDAEGCRFAIDAPVSADTVVATLRDGTGVAIAFGIGRVGSGLEGVRIDLADPAARMAAIELPIPSPSRPPSGLDAVVGVPGLLTSSGVVILDQMPSVRGSVAVPELSGAIADGSWWLLAEAGPSFIDRSRRSVILQRGLRDPSAPGAWPAWLEAPELTIEAGAPSFSPVSGASVHVLDWLAPDGAVLASAWVLDPSAPLAFAPDVAAERIRLRAIDAPGASPGALDLRAVERAIVRFSETTLPFSE